MGRDDAGAPSERIVVEIGLGRRDVAETPEPIGAAHQHGVIDRGLGLAQMGGDVVDGETDPTPIGAVRRRGVRQSAVMKRRFARRAFAMDDVVLVDGDVRFLAGVRKLSSAKLSLRATKAPRWLAWTKRMQPLARSTSLEATQALTTPSSSSRPQ